VHVTSKHRGLISEGPPRASALRGVACSTGLGDGGCAFTLGCRSLQRDDQMRERCSCAANVRRAVETKHEAKKRARRHASRLQGFRERYGRRTERASALSHTAVLALPGQP
jgi:hypothetical protein